MKSLKILIIEDELVTAYDIQETLEKAGHVITDIVRNASTALHAVRQNPPDIALVDIHLEHSEEDGIMIAKRLLDNYDFPVIYLTGNSEQATISRAQQTRPTAYLLKPFRHKELAIQVELAYYNFQASQLNEVDPFMAEDLYLPIKQGKAYTKIAKNEVMYLEADGAYVKVYLFPNAHMQVFSMNLGYLSQYFSAPNFYELSRSLLVNLKYVESIEKGQFFLKDIRTPVQFPENNHKAFLQQFAVVKTPPKKIVTPSPN